MDPSSVSHAFTRILRQAGLPHICFHDLRHTHATLLIMVGVHPKVISETVKRENTWLVLSTYEVMKHSRAEALAEFGETEEAEEEIQFIE